MHSQRHWEALFARDGQLSELSVLLDPSNIADCLSLDPGNVQLDYIRYKPKTNCLARFRVHGAGSDYVYAKTYSVKDRARLSNALLKVSDGCDAPIQYHPGCLLYTFPADAKLGSLSKLAREKTWLNERFGLTEAALKREILAYKPERRCVIKLQDERTSYVLKLFTKQAFEFAYQAAHRSNHRTVRTPRVLRKSRRHQTLLFEYIEGPTLRAEVLAGRGALGCSIAGRLLAEFHRSTISSTPFKTTGSADHGLLIWLLPEATEQIQSIVATAEAVIGSTQASNVALHGDFYDKQIILSPAGNPVLLDLDESGQGDHRFDLATFIAHLESLSPNDASSLVQSFLSAYTSASQQSLRALPAYVALSILQLSHHAFRRGSVHWQSETYALISRAQQWLDRTGDFR